MREWGVGNREWGMGSRLRRERQASTLSAPPKRRTEVKKGGILMSSQLLNKLSSKALEVLIRYPFWRNAVQESHLKPQIPPDSPTVVECFDQSGLLLSRVSGYTKTVSVPQQHRSLFLAMYFDGELVFFAVENEVVVHRIKLFSVFSLLG